jgi:predicted nucleic acid-binding protein
LRRLVIDANILASGSVDPHGESPPSLIYRDLDGSRFEAIACPELLGEIADACTSPTS